MVRDDFGDDSSEKVFATLFEEASLCADNVVRVRDESCCFGRRVWSDVENVPDMVCNGKRRPLEGDTDGVR